MNNLITITNGEQKVSARELHESLEVHSNFTTWFGRMTEYGFTENVDYKKCFPNLESGLNGGQNKVDYQITVEMAKEICMIQRTDIGKRCREYFLEIERRYKAQMKSLSPEELLFEQARLMLEHSKRLSVGQHPTPTGGRISC